MLVVGLMTMTACLAGAAVVAPAAHAQSYSQCAARNFTYPACDRYLDPIEVVVTADPVAPPPGPYVDPSVAPPLPVADGGSGVLVAGADIPPRSATLPVTCEVFTTLPAASPEAASQSAKESCNGQISKKAQDAARDLAIDANKAAEAAGQPQRYQGVFTCDVPVEANWSQAPVGLPYYFASARGSGTCILNAVPL